jgi:tetratricopeptide (TPR) repeat protein
MYHYGSRTLLFVTILALLALVLIGCEKAEEKGPAMASNAGKIPVTTSSEDARKEFLQARDIAESLRLQDSIQHYDKAISLDPNFALAELGRANVAQSAKDFFAHLNKAVSLADKASDGERMLIQATEAGANADPAKQKELLEKLVAAYPNDERAHLALGGYYFGQQDYTKAIEHYKRATELSATFSPAYNILGYAYRQNGDYANAEQAFKKYIELIPNDPNPYDSYAELLLKMGRFSDSIEQYHKALSVDANFINSHLGIAADLMYMGKPDEAAAEIQKITDKARSDGDRRTALFALAVLNADSGKLDKAVETVDKEYAIAEKAGDDGNMSADLQLKANILLEAGKYDDAKQAFDRSLAIVQNSKLSQEIKENAALVHHYNLARVALGKKDMATASAETAAFTKGAETAKNPNQIKLAHELAGMLALEGKNYDQAIAELNQANLQNPYNLYRLAQAYEGKGDKAKAKEFGTKAAEFNSLPQANYAFIRAKAEKMAGASA